MHILDKIALQFLVIKTSASIHLLAGLSKMLTWKLKIFYHPNINAVLFIIFPGQTISIHINIFIDQLTNIIQSSCLVDFT